ncbi:hypothetical protein FOA52_003175 [Chlamydomonas sp. UWO 241]|nr:hypothetical protein FOA52_003175 [Chlamydomonas sp. UWO 241]
MVAAQHRPRQPMSDVQRRITDCVASPGCTGMTRGCVAHSSSGREGEVPPAGITINRFDDILEHPSSWSRACEIQFDDGDTNVYVPNQPGPLPSRTLVANLHDAPPKVQPDSDGAEAEGSGAADFVGISNFDVLSRDDLFSSWRLAEGRPASEHPLSHWRLEEGIPISDSEADVTMLALQENVEEHFGWTLQADDKVMTVHMLFVEARNQGRGIGTALLRQAEDTARSAGASLIQLRTDTSFERVVEFYTSQGFTMYRDSGECDDKERMGMIKMLFSTTTWLG